MDPNQRPSQVAFGDEAINKVMKGVYAVCEATALTLSPRGRNVLIDKGWEHVIVHDGVSVAESINPSDPWEQAGAKVAKEAAKKQRDTVGDGTTVVLILMQAILKECLKATGSGVNPRSIEQSLVEASKKVIAKIEEYSTPITTLEQKTQIATISAQDEELGQIIAKTIHEIGDDGILTVEESKLADTIVEKQQGMQLERGYCHPFFVTDPERQLAVAEDTSVLVTDMMLSSPSDMSSFLNTEVVQNTSKLVIIAPEITGDFLTMLIMAKAKGLFQPLAVRAPWAGPNQLELLQDIAALTGAHFFSKDSDYNFNDAKFSDLGRARVVSSKLSTIITEGKGKRADILSRIAGIKVAMEDPDLSEFDKEKLRERLGKLTNGIAVIKVGGETEVEMKERKERAIDAVAATQAACKYGVVPGGEVIYLNALNAIMHDKSLGSSILLQALKQPFKRLVEHAGFDGGEKYSEILPTPMGTGFDVIDGEFKDMKAHGIIDPTAVPVNAIKSAVSVASKLMTLGAAVVPEPTPNAKT
jgi:chaperonin GroEL